MCVFDTPRARAPNQTNGAFGGVNWAVTTCQMSSSLRAGVLHARVPVSKHHRPGGLNDRSVSPHRLGGWEAGRLGSRRGQVGLLSGLPPGHVDGPLLPVSSHGCPSVSVS